MTDTVEVTNYFRGLSCKRLLVTINGTTTRDHVTDVALSWAGEDRSSLFGTGIWAGNKFVRGDRLLPGQYVVVLNTD